MQNVALGISYNGTPFKGWQYQTDVPTVQGELQTAISKIENTQVQIRVAGRTDAGVHATGQVASFVSHSERAESVWWRGLNGLTSDHIRVNWVKFLSPDFNPRYSAVARRYLYVFQDQGIEPFANQLAWQCTRQLDADVMHRAAGTLIGEHNFSSFRGAGCQSLTPMRRINKCQVRRVGNLVVLDIEGNAFLLHMVRNIARALHDIGVSGDEKLMSTWLAAKDRREIGATAPPQGLYLAEVIYPSFNLPGSNPPFWLNLR